MFDRIVVSCHAASFQRGYRWTASSRDAEVPPLTGVAGRLEKAFRNFLETFPVFAAAVFLVHILDRESALSEWGSLSFREAGVSFALRSRGSLAPLARLERRVSRNVLLLVASVWPV
ncbi:MAG: MAPEG family protein [Stellaceae bacterium]